MLRFMKFICIGKSSHSFETKLVLNYQELKAEPIYKEEIRLGETQKNLRQCRTPQAACIMGLE